MMKRYMISITEEMAKKLEEERKKRLLDSIPETVRMILSEYLSKR
jgi:metal-responsive CopG/Arc/MetJ family transcriptional regulator